MPRVSTSGPARGGDGYDQASALQVDVNGHAWVAGSTESSLDGHSNAGGRDIFLMNFDGEGVHQWTKQRGGEGSDLADALQVDPTGNDAWVAGNTKSSLDGHSNAGKTDIFLMKFQAECSHATCPAGYARSPSQKSGGNSMCCMLSSTSTSSWTSATTASTSITTTASSTKTSTSITRTRSSTTASTSTTSATTATTASASARAEETLPAIIELPGSQLEVVEILQMPMMPNPLWVDLKVNSAGKPGEDDSFALLLAAVLLPLLIACLCAALGIWCYRAKLRQLRGVTARPNRASPKNVRISRVTCEFMVAADKCLMYLDISSHDACFESFVSGSTCG
eukprot:s939_g19.t1